jgi:hypothetical protein
MENIKEKIKKLLSLAESPNEHEAKAALLKARELMARHKLTEAELEGIEKQEVKTITVSGITCSKRKNPWIVNLSGTIAENYCCKGFRRHEPGKQTQYFGFIGLEEDVAICEAIFRYAVDCALSKCKEIKKENSCYYPEYVRRLCDSFGYGFSMGLQIAFEEQAEQQENGWGLVLVTPKEVEEAAKHLGHEKFEAKSQKHIDSESFYDGYHEGKNFKPERRLEV